MKKARLHKKEPTIDWVKRSFADPEFRRLYARETFIEEFIQDLQIMINTRGLSRSALCKHLGWDPEDIKLISERRKELTLEMIIDLAYCLGLTARLTYFEAGIARSS